MFLPSPRYRQLSYEREEFADRAPVSELRAAKTEYGLHGVAEHGCRQCSGRMADDMVLPIRAILVLINDEFSVACGKDVVNMALSQNARGTLPDRGIIMLRPLKVQYLAVDLASAREMIDKAHQPTVDRRKPVGVSRHAGLVEASS